MGSSKIFIHLLTGIAVGAAAGILLAPHSGAKTRKKISKRTRKFLGNVKDKAEEITSPLKDGYKTAKENLAKSS